MGRGKTWRRLRLAAYVAQRIVRSRRTPTLSLVTLISVLGIAVGVMALTVVLSVTSGFEHAFQERILGLYPHLVITSESSRFDDYPRVLQAIRDTPGVVGASPLTGDSMMIAHGVFRAGATIQGIEPATVDSVIGLRKIVRSGSIDGLREDPTVERARGAVTLGQPVEGAWMTLIVEDDGQRLLFDRRTSPDSGFLRVKAIDLRPPGADPVALSPRSGPVIDVYKYRTTETYPLPRGDERPFTTELELPAGQYELAPTGEVVDLAKDTLTTLLVRPAPEGGGVETLVMEEPAEVARLERTAFIRVVDARTGGEALTTRVAGAEAPLATTEPGEFTEFTMVPARLPGILLGVSLAERLRAKVGTELTLVTPLRGIDGKSMGPFGMLPSSSHFTVAGIFEAGFHDHDSKLAIINLDVAQRFLNRGRIVQSIAVRTESLAMLDAVRARVGRAIDPFPFEELVRNAESLRDKLHVLVQPGFSGRKLAGGASFIGGLRNATEAVNLLKFQRNDYARRTHYRIFDWKEKNINLFRALELQKVVLTMFFLIIIVVGSFVVVGSQTMIVHEKTADIAILKTMGATRGLVRLIFTLQGMFVAATGAVAGLLLGVGFVALIGAVDYKLEASIYLIDHLPADIDPVALVLITLGALLCTLLTTQISASRAANKTPVEGLRAVD